MKAEPPIRQANGVAKEFLSPFVPGENDDSALPFLCLSMGIVTASQRLQQFSDLHLEILHQAIHLRLMTGIQQVPEFVKEERLV